MIAACVAGVPSPSVSRRSCLILGLETNLAIPIIACSRVNMPIEQMGALHMIGRLHFGVDDPETAESYLKRAAEIGERIRSSSNSAEFHQSRHPWPESMKIWSMASFGCGPKRMELRVPAGRSRCSSPDRRSVC